MTKRGLRWDKLPAGYTRLDGGLLPAERYRQAAEKARESGLIPANAPTAAIQPRQRAGRKKTASPVPYERDVLRAVLAALKAHPRVAWAVRLNSGMAMLPGKGGKPQPVRFGFSGCPDIIGQVTASVYADIARGLFLAVEVKRPGKKPTLEQAAFLLRVREAGGVGFVATGVEDVWKHLGKP